MEETRLSCRIARLYKLETLLMKQGRMGLRVVEMARETGVNRRTIYRDIELMCEIGIPIWQADGLYGITAPYVVPGYRQEVREKLEAKNGQH